jgi:hypothetical protein
MGDADAEDDRDENRQILEFAHTGVLRLPICQDAELLDLIPAVLTPQLGRSGSKQTDSDWPGHGLAESASDRLLPAYCVEKLVSGGGISDARKASRCSRSGLTEFFVVQVLLGRFIGMILLRQ